MKQFTSNELSELVQSLDALPSTPCPCGTARRAFLNLPHSPQASVHWVDIKQSAQTHYHQKTTEIYVVLEGEGFIELNGIQFPIKPLTAVYIYPGIRHRAIGNLKILNIPIPAFDSSDEFIVES